jgi:thiamine monophosphate kinase
LLFVDLKPGVYTPNSGVRIGIWRESVEFEATMGVSDALVQRLKLITLEWTIRIDISIQELDDDTRLLDATDRELIMGEWRD